VNAVLKKWKNPYNIIALPLAVGLLHKGEIMLSLAAGAVLMSLSTIVVAIRSEILKRISPEKIFVKQDIGNYENNNKIINE
jgi:hypothetical protein